jgi:uncharacterized protein (TIGR00661 family)
MKILFGIQATGNGHISRSTEIYKLLKEHPEVTQLDVLISGGKSKMSLPFEVNYQYKAFSFYYGMKGKISILKSIGKASFTSFAYALMSVPFRDYDLIISDFEPITLWGAKLFGVKAVGIGNMYSVTSKKFPKTEGTNTTKFFANVMCPAKNKIGMHFQKFDDFIYYPIIRSEIRNLKPTEQDFTLVYLNSYSDDELTSCFNQPIFDKQKFIIYSKTSDVAYEKGNCIVKPLNNEQFVNDMCHCKNVITAAGFQTVCEALYLGKKLFVIPIKKQTEQISNARELAVMGVKTAQELNASEIKYWMDYDKPVKIKFDNDLPQIINAILNAPHEGWRRKAA